MRHRILAFVVLLSAATGCENLIELELPDSSSEIVVIAPFTVDIPWQVSLQRTINPQNTTPMPATIENATVIIRGDDGSVVELPHMGGGFYSSPTTFPKVGINYTLTVDADGFKRVEATDRIPDPVIVRDVRISDVGPEQYFDIEIQDDKNIENYYELAILNSQLNFQDFIVINSELDEQMRSFAIQDPLAPDLSRPELKRALIRDTPFNGDTYVISITQTQARSPFEKNVYIRTVSKAHYEYYRSQIIQENANDLPFAEPAGILSNIQNGHGIFAGYHLQVHGETTFQDVTDRLFGTYTATMYEIFDKETGTPNRLDYVGASIELTLHPDYSTTGQMYLPPLDPDISGDQVKVVPLNGAYSIQGYDSFYGYYLVTLYHSSDTILRDIPFRIRPSSPEYFYLESLLTRSYYFAAQSDARFSGGDIRFSRVEE